MKRCKFDEFIDDYLMNKLKNEEKNKFEEHYFHCQHCFEKMLARYELLRLIKTKGQTIFYEEERGKNRKEAFFIEKITSFLTPKQWAFTTSLVILGIILCLSAGLLLKKPQPQFFLDKEDIVRGESIILISPVKNVKTIPSQFMWKKMRENVEYKISLYLNQELIWTAITKETTLPLSEEVKNLIQADQKYSWQVKAFSPQGTLIAVSSKTQFKIASIE